LTEVTKGHGKRGEGGEHSYKRIAIEQVAGSVLLTVCFFLWRHTKPVFATFADYVFIEEHYRIGL
jgi:hypothetical protein